MMMIQWFDYGRENKTKRNETQRLGEEDEDEGLGACRQVARSMALGGLAKVTMYNLI